MQWVTYEQKSSWSGQHIPEGGETLQ